MSTVCLLAQSVADFRSWAASWRFFSRVWMSDSTDLRAAETVTWVFRRVCGWLSIDMSWSMIVAVSIPDESPEMLWVLLAIQRGPASHVERLRRRDRPDHVAVEVAYLHGHVAAVGHLEVQLALLVAQLAVDAGCRVHVLEHRRRRRRGERAHVHCGVERRAEVRLRCRRAARGRLCALDSAWYRRNVEVHRSSWNVSRPVPGSAAPAAMPGHEGVFDSPGGNLRARTCEKAPLGTCPSGPHERVLGSRHGYAATSRLLRSIEAAAFPGSISRASRAKTRASSGISRAFATSARPVRAGASGPSSWITEIHSSAADSR